MKSGKICYSELCLLGDPKYITYKDGAWSLDEVALNKVYCAVANAGAEWQRIMPWSPWYPHPQGMKSQFSPYRLVHEKFDLNAFNDYYFPIAKRVIAIAKSYGIKTWFCLADNCQFHGPTRRWSPWVTNINGVWSIYEPKAYPFFKKWIAKCLTEFAELGLGWTWCNEGKDPDFRKLANAVIFPFIKAGQIKLNNSALGVGMTDANYMDGRYRMVHLGVQEWLGSDVEKAFGTKKDVWREVHGVGGRGYDMPPNPLHQALTWWGNHPIKIWLSDDGVWDGDSPCDWTTYNGKMQRRPSAVTWSRVAAIAKAYKNSFVFEHLPKGGSVNCQVITLRAIYRALNGVYPIEKWHYEPPAPPTPPTPPTPPAPPEPPAPVKPCSYWFKRLNFKRWVKCVFSGKH